MRVQVIRDFIPPGEKRTRKCGEIFEVPNEEAAAMVRASLVVGKEFSSAIRQEARRIEVHG